MTKKKKSKEFQVNYGIRNIVGVNVCANNYEEAIEKANKIVEKYCMDLNSGYKNIEYIDGDLELCGFSDFDSWNIDFIKEK